MLCIIASNNNIKLKITALLCFCYCLDQLAIYLNSWVESANLALALTLDMLEFIIQALFLGSSMVEQSAVN